MIPAPKRRGLRFSLRGLLIATAVAAYVALEMHKSYEDWQARRRVDEKFQIVHGMRTH
jgi:hypothetical protein